ncbi:hypothetical protein [Adhaeretor mobilis]|nr:hypothetical protein [Adhaeretor mobilis]
MNRSKQSWLLIAGTRTCMAVLLAIALVGPQPARAQEDGKPTIAPSAEATSAAAMRVETKLDELEEWIAGGEENSKKLLHWQGYLKLDDLREELDAEEPDPAVVMRILRQFRTEAKGLHMGPFRAVHNALNVWSQQLKTPKGSDLADYARAARGDHTPITQDELISERAKLRSSVQALEQSLNVTPYAGTWKEFLQWELLEPQLSDESKVTRESLTDLEIVLRRFRMNKPGLEIDAFRNVADRLEAFIPTVTWATTAKVRDASAAYDGLLKSLEEQLDRHGRQPTGETQWKVSRVYELAKQLGDSPQLVSAMHSRLSQPNLFVRVSEGMINRTAQRPVTNQQPVVDCILGTSIRGTACTQGRVTFHTQPADDQIVIQTLFTGQTASNTIGYNKPVNIYSTGTTSFNSLKQLVFTDDAFYVGAASAKAVTRTRINRISKTGGQFGRKLVEKIAWKKAGESKGQAERIAASHAETKVATGFDEQVFPAMVNGRKRYLEKVITPLMRRALKPEYLRMHSTSHGIGIDTLIARSTQLGASVPAPPLMPGHDLSFQVHESAVNNYLPLALAGVTISQDETDLAPKVTGDAPPWLNRISEVRKSAKDVTDEVVDTLEPVLADPNADSDPQEGDEGEHAFQPWSITLNNDFPASASFGDGNLAIRMRASLLASGEREFKNWDFIVTYKFVKNDNGILLRRVGKIEVLPTGFDPEWDKKMSTTKSGFRNTLAKNMNDRADRGESFPKEIPIPPITIPDLGTLTLRQIDSEAGWLTLGWGLP